MYIFILILVMLSSPLFADDIKFTWEGCTPSCNLFLITTKGASGYYDVKSPLRVSIPTGCYSAYLCQVLPDGSEDTGACIYLLKQSTLGGACPRRIK
jgi:hypothetical protein